jgi:cytochrome c556
MKSRKLLATMLVAAVFAVPAWALQQVSAEDYDAAMKTIRTTQQGVGDHLTAQSAADLGTDGAALVEQFTKVNAYWTGRNEAAAMELVAKALAAARQFQEAGAAGNFDAASAAFDEMRTTCTPCHESYRERDADGNWQIKAGS